MPLSSHCDMLKSSLWDMVQTSFLRFNYVKCPFAFFQVSGAFLKERREDLGNWHLSKNPKILLFLFQVILRSWTIQDVRTLTCWVSDLRIMTIFWSLWNLSWCDTMTFFLHVPSQKTTFHFWYLLSSLWPWLKIHFWQCLRVCEPVTLDRPRNGKDPIACPHFSVSFARFIHFDYGQYCVSDKF